LSEPDRPVEFALAVVYGPPGIEIDVVHGHSQPQRVPSGTRITPGIPAQPYLPIPSGETGPPIP
jgi:hypothetical protein